MLLKGEITKEELDSAEWKTGRCDFCGEKDILITEIKTAYGVENYCKPCVEHLNKYVIDQRKNWKG